MKMRVLIWCCGFKERFAGHYVAAEMQRQGHDVVAVGSRTRPRRMIIGLRNYKPDVVFSFAIRPNLKRYYKMIRDTGAKLVLWYPDMTESTRDRMWRGFKGCADMLIFSILETAQRYKDLAPHVLWMPQYFDHRFCSIDGEGTLPKRLDPKKEIYDLCFIGSCDKLRNDWLDKLQKRYKCLFHLDGIKTKKEIRGLYMSGAYAQSKIAFNIQRQLFLNPGDYVTSNRVYNAMGSGAFFINYKVQKMDLVMKKGFHCEMHDDSFNDLCRLIDYYLEHEKEREQIAKQGQELILRHHTLEVRAKEYWLAMRLLFENQLKTLEFFTEEKTKAFGGWSL